jgi:hypothetical protein
MDAPLSPDPRLAVHGFSLALPDGAEPVGTYGHARSGHAIIALGREPLLAVSWERVDMQPEPARTLRNAARSLKKSDRRLEATGQRDLRGGVVVGTWRGSRGDWHIGMRHCADARLCLIARQLVPGTPGAIAAMLAEASAFPIDGAWPWRIHGLSVDLGPWWRLAGLHNVAGLARGVWFRHTPKQRDAVREGVHADAVLVVRRFALMSRLLAGGTPLDWLRANLGTDERIVADRPAGAAIEAEVDAPGRTWWRRWRGRRERRRYRLEADPQADRLIVREFVGDDERPPW